MRSLSIDIETFSSVDLTRSGFYAYTASPDFEILIFAYGMDEEPVKIVDLAMGERIPLDIVEAIRDDKVIKRAFNGAFERVCLSTHLKEELPPHSWRCTAIQAGAMGYPLSLEGAAKALDLQVQKMVEGKALIRFFSMDSKEGGGQGEGRRNLPWHHEEKWEMFKEYCKRDVEVERAISKKLKNFEISPKEQKLYELDQRINHRGVLVDLDLVDRAIQCDYLYKNKILKEGEAIITTINPKSPGQIKQWLRERGIEVDTLSKKVVENLIKEIEERAEEIQEQGKAKVPLTKGNAPLGEEKGLEAGGNFALRKVGEEGYPLKPGGLSLSPEALGEISQVLNLRLKVSRTSTKKYEAIKRGVSPDNRVRGLFQFYGANRTGR